MKSLFFFLVSVFFTGSLLAQTDGIKVLSLDQWRSQQITEAENRIVRLSNRITLIKASTGNINEINKLESERRIAAHSVELVKQLTIEDYFNVYLSQLANRDADLVQAAGTMSKEEMGRLLKILLKERTNSASDSSIPSVITGLAKQEKPLEPRL